MQRYRRQWHLVSLPHRRPHSRRPYSRITKHARIIYKLESRYCCEITEEAVIGYNSPAAHTVAVASPVVRPNVAYRRVSFAEGAHPSGVSSCSHIVVSESHLVLTPSANHYRRPSTLDPGPLSAKRAAFGPGNATKHLWLATVSG